MPALCLGTRKREKRDSSEQLQKAVEGCSTKETEQYAYCSTAVTLFSNRRDYNYCREITILKKLGTSANVASCIQIYSTFQFIVLKVELNNGYC